MSPQEAIAEAGCVACLPDGDQEVLITLAALGWLAFIDGGSVRPVTPMSPQDALTLPVAPCVDCLSFLEKETIITSSDLVQIGLILAGGVRPLPTVTPQDALSLPIGGCVICLPPGVQKTIRALSALSQLNWLQETSMTPQEAIAGAGCVICLPIGTQRTIQTIAAIEMIDYIDGGGCPPGPPLVSYDVYWGNYIWPEFPDPAPVFVEADITGVNALYVDRDTDLLATRVGTYEFATREGARQLIWFPDALGAPTFLSNGLEWPLDPAYNTALQTLTILGVPGKLYFTSQQNSGTYTITVT